MPFTRQEAEAHALRLMATFASGVLHEPDEAERSVARREWPVHALPDTEACAKLLAGLYEMQNSILILAQLTVERMATLGETSVLATLSRLVESGHGEMLASLAGVRLLDSPDAPPPDRPPLHLS